MRLGDILDAEWVPALGCTEPASIALAASWAATLARGDVEAVRLRCDARTYKNCYAVGIPHSEHKTGILWALALGTALATPERGLEVFRDVDPRHLAAAAGWIDAGRLTVEVEPDAETLHIDCRVEGSAGTGRTVIEGAHTRVVLLERDGAPQPTPSSGEAPDAASVRAELAGRSFDELLALAATVTRADRERLREGARLNVTIARHGLSLFPPRFVDGAGQASLTRLSRLVCAGVYARMCGEPLTVMSVAGSGNKGIVVSVPLFLWGREAGFDDARVDEALALSCLVTSATTHHLGTLSAVCGCSNAAGIGLAAGLVHLENGGAEAVSLAVTNMVGNVTGMICDGAKIGCAMKTMTAVDAAFRSSSLALSGIGIPATDGIVGRDGMTSLANLGRIATRGMRSADAEILAIMQEKLARRGAL